MNSRPSRAARGNVLIEFAIALIAFITIAFAGIELGRAFFTAQVVGEGARITARESATRPGALGVPEDTGVFDERFTAIDIDNLRDPSNPDTTAFTTDVDGDGDVDVRDLFQILPPAHSALRSIMIRENRDDIGAGTRRLLRFPGTLLRDPVRTLGADLIVRVPDIVSESPTLDLFLHRVVNLAYDPATNIVRSEANFHYQFNVFMAAPSAVGPYKNPIDTTVTPPVILNPADIGSFTTAIDFGLGRPGAMKGFFRNGMIQITQFGAARKEIP